MGCTHIDRQMPQRGVSTPRPTRCHCSVSAGEKHAAGCRPARPLCRWMRRRADYRRPCRCSALPYPHRAGWCALHGETPLAIRQSPSWRAA